MKKRKGEENPSSLPTAVMADIPYTTLSGDREVTVENYRGIISYESDGVRINTREKIIQIEGEDLTLSHITDEVICVSGRILCLKFI